MDDSTKNKGWLPVYVDKKFSIDKLDPRFQEEYRDLLEDYFSNLGKLTARAYKFSLKAFFEYTSVNFKVPSITSKGVQFHEVKRLHVVRYRNYMQSDKYRNGKPAAPQTIISALSAIKSFYQHLMERDLAKNDPTSGVKRPKAVVMKETEALEDSEVMELFDLIDEINSSARPMHKAILTLLFTTGIRDHSLRHLKLNDLKEDIGFEYFEFIGKGEVKHKVPLHPTTSHYLKLYFLWMKEQDKEIKEDDYIFRATRGKNKDANIPITAEGLRYIVKKYASKVTKKYICGPHIGRSSLISSLLEDNVDLYKVSQMAGHKSTTTTQGYDKSKKKLKDSPIFGLNFYNKTKKK